MTPEPEGKKDVIDLAHVAPFRLGEVEVHPATRQIVRAEQCETLEPRVMQVLVALAQARGAVLTRDELIALCWEGRIVGDNAIHRVISRIRQVASDFGMHSFQLETITKVGYRMVVGPTGKALEVPSIAPAAPHPTGMSRRTAIAVGGSAVVAMGFLGALMLRGVSSAGPSQDALALYRKGVDARGQALPEQGMQAVAYFREAVRLDPGFADAWGALALGYRALLEYGPRPDVQQIAAWSRSAAMRALELDRDNPDARAALILIDPFYGNWATIEQRCRELLARYPNHNVVRYNLGWCLNEVGRSRAAVDMLLPLDEAEPFWPLARHFFILALWNAGRFEEVQIRLEDAARRWPGHPLIWQTRMNFLTMAGQPESAIALGADAGQRPIGYPPAQLEMRMAVARALASGADSRREVAGRTILAQTERNPELVLVAAQLSGALGRSDDAFGLLDGYYFGRGRWATTAPRPDTQWTRRYTGLLFSPMMTSLRRHPRFAALTASVGLDAYWRATHSQPDFRRS